MKLALGTVQFGLDYGVANRHGQMSIDESASIVRMARRAGVDTLDTAVSYGDSESRLGNIGVEDWKIITKLPPVPAQVGDINNWAEETVRLSLDRLNVRSLHGLLMHRSSDISDPGGETVFDALQNLKQLGLVRKVGVSIYHPCELEAIVPRYRVDLVQVPYNVIDRRFATSGWLQKLKQLGVETHARSAFLQGLLLLDVKGQSERFTEWTNLWVMWHEWLKKYGLTPLQGALGFALSEPLIDRVVVGVDDTRQFQEILEAAADEPPPAPEALALEDDRLVNPANWIRA